MRTYRAKTLRKITLAVTAALLGTILTLGPASWSALAEAPQSGPGAGAALVFILDGSGSMWGRIKERPKIVIAKKVLADLIAEMGEETNLGLVAYGHRREADCRDVEVLVPLGRPDRDLVLKRLNSLSPKGKSPIGRAIRQTVDMVSEMKGPVTLILVSDGKETCGGDPCRLVKNLRETTLDFRMHVIGFAVTPEETEELECIARAGEGKYYSAQTARELEMAVRQLTVETLLPKGPALAVGAVKNSRMVKAQITILAQGEKDLEVVRFGDTERFNPQLFHLEEGEYEIRVTDDSTAQGQVLSQRIRYEGRNKVVLFYFEEGRLKIETFKNNRPAPARVVIVEAGSGTQAVRTDTRTANPVEIVLPPGLYEARVSDLENPDRPPMTIPAIRIKGDSIVEEKVDFPEGTLLVDILANGKPTYGGLDVFRSETKDWVRSADTAGENPVAVPLLPGVYDIKVVEPELKGQPPLEYKKIRVRAGAKIRIRANFSEAVLNIRVLINGREGPGKIEITRSQTDHVVFGGDTSDRNPVSLKILPGTYDIKVIDPNVAAYPFYPFRMKQGLEISPGQTENLTFEFQEGTLSLRLRAGEPGGEGVYYIYSSGSGEEAASGSLVAGREVRLRLEPGSYDAVLETRRGREPLILRREEIQILAGFTTVVDFSLDEPRDLP